MKLKRLSLFLALVMILSAFAGTFTFASAATAGGTFTINGGDPITGQICNQTLQDGDVIVLQSDYVVTATESSVFTAGITIDGDSNGDGKADHTVTLTARWFNYGDSNNSTVSYGDKTLTFKNLNIVSKANSIIQSQNHQAKVVVDNCVIENNSTDGRGFTLANGSHQTLIFTNSKVTTYCAANAGNGFIYAASANDTVTITDCEFVGSMFRGGGSNWGCFVYMGADNAVLNMTRVSMDSSMANYHRLVYTNKKAGVWTIKDSIFVGSDDSHDVFQVTSGETAISFEDVVFMGGGSNDTGKVIIRNYAIPYYSADDTYNQIRVLGRSAKYATDADLLKHFGKDPTVTGTNYDAAAANMGYKFRLTDATTAYANGTFAGYYTCWKDASNAVGTAIKADTTIYVIGDFFNRIERQNYTYANGETFAIQGVDADGDGVYPTITSTTALYRANYTNTAGTLVYKNLNFEMINSWFGQLNFGTMKIENCNIKCGGTNSYGIVVQKNTVLKMIDSTINYTGAGTNIRLNDANARAELTNTNVIASGTGAPVYARTTGATLIYDEDTTFTAAIGDAIEIDVGSQINVNGVQCNSGATVLTGASVRIAKGATAENLVQSGIRFESTLTAEQLAAIEVAKAAGATVSYGTIILRNTDYTTGNNGGTFSNVYDFIEAVNASETDALKIAKIQAVNGIVMNEDGSATIRAALINIKEANYGVDFVSVAYVEYTLEDGQVVTIYGSTSNVRSIKTVAEAALADTKTAEEIEANGSATFGSYNYTNEITVEIEGVETTVYSCYSDEQIAILNTYAGK